jgi:AcrR family transcriptional regulator
MTWVTPVTRSRPAYSGRTVTVGVREEEPVSETSEAEAQPRRRRDAAATRQALLSATRRLLTERGVAGTSTRDIAALAGVNQTLVYRYFGSKEKLVGEAAGGGGRASVDVTATPMGELPRALLEDMFDRSEAAADRDGAAFWSLVGGANDEVVRDVLREHIDTMFGRDLAGRLDGPDAAVRAELFAALLTGLAFLRTKIEAPALTSADRDTIAGYVEEVAGVLLARDAPGRSATRS